MKKIIALTIIAFAIFFAFQIQNPLQNPPIIEWRPPVTQNIEPQIEQPVKQGIPTAQTKPIGGIIEPQKEKITILNKEYTLAGYNTLKTDIISKMANRKIILPQQSDFQKWIEIAKKECPKMVLTDITEVNLVDRINSYIQNGCK